MILHVPVQKESYSVLTRVSTREAKQTVPALVKQRTRIGAAHFSWAAARTITYILKFCQGDILLTVRFSTITTMPPTFSADSSVGSALSQGSGLSFDAGAFNSGNKGVKMDAHKLDKPYAYIGGDCCRAAFTLAGSKDPLVCGLFLTQCTRPGHKILRGPAKSRAPAGYYRLASKKGHLADGVNGTYLSEEDYAAIEEAQLEDNRQATLRLTGKGPTDYEGEEEEDAKLPAKGSVTPDRVTTRSSKVETLMVETVSDEDSVGVGFGFPSPEQVKAGVPLQGSWAQDSGILKGKLLGKPTLGPKTPPPVSSPHPVSKSAPKAAHAGVGSGGQDSMLFALMRQLETATTSLSAVTAELDVLRKEKEAAKAPTRSDPTFVPPVLASRKWYAVCVGRKPGVYGNAADAVAQTNGFPNSALEKFGSYEEAKDYYDLYMGMLQAENEQRALQAMDEARAAERASMAEPAPAPAYVDPTPVETPTPTVPAPGPSFMTADPSVGDPKKVFGHKTGTEHELRKRLSPNGILPIDQKDLAACMIDATALPGTSMKHEAEPATDLEEMTAALKELSAGREDRRNVAVKTDGSWRSGTRNPLSRITNEDELQELSDTVRSIEETVRENMHAVMATVIDQYLWDEHVIQYWTQGNLFSRIAVSSMNDYQALMAHVLQMARRNGWIYAKKTLNFHAKKLTLIRNTALSRLNALTSIYIYLRDARVDKFNAPELQEMKNAELYSEFARLEKEITTVAAPKCGKCHGSSHVHKGGRAACPFKNMKDAEARKKAAVIDQQYQDPSPSHED